MKIKKRLVISNTVMLIVPVILIIIIASGVIDAMADSYHDQLLKFQEQFLNGTTKDFEKGFQTMISGMRAMVISSIAFIVLSSILVIVLINSFLSARFTKSIMIPLNLLSLASKRIKEGDLDFRLEYQGKDEFEQVCLDFDEMRRRLKESIEMQLKYEKDKQELIADISHDLRTPITVIKGYVEGLRDGVANTQEKQKRYLDMIHKKACDMDSLVDNLFLFSNMDTKHYPFHFQKTDIGQYFNEFFIQAKAEFIQKGLEISLDNSTIRDVFVKIDHMEMDRVFTNILENSVKYKAAELGKVHAKLNHENQCIIITIADDGPGVKTDDLDRLFTRFYRGDSSRTNPHEGSGLGLAIAKHIANAHGGTIKARNNHGLEVIITLPIVEMGNEHEENTDH